MSSSEPLGISDTSFGEVLNESSEGNLLETLNQEVKTNQELLAVTTAQAGAVALTPQTLNPLDRVRLSKSMKRRNRKLKTTAKIVLKSTDISQPSLGHLVEAAGAPQGLLAVEVGESEGKVVSISKNITQPEPKQRPVEECAGGQPGPVHKPVGSKPKAPESYPSSSVIGTMGPPSMPAAKGSGVPRDTVNKAAWPQGQAPTQPTNLGKRPGSPGTSAPAAKKPKDTPPNSTSDTRGLLVAVVPSRYPQIQLTREQSDRLKELIADKVDYLDEDGEHHPAFDGASFKMGGCIVCCQDEATKIWLDSIIPSITLGEGVSLRTGDAIELTAKYCKIGTFFPGRVLTEEKLMKRIRIQNACINGVTLWTLLYLKELEKGFYAIFKIPESSLDSLRERSMKMNYGIYSPTVKLLKNKHNVEHFHGGNKEVTYF